MQLPSGLVADGLICCLSFSGAPQQNLRVVFYLALYSNVFAKLRQ